MQAHTTKFPHDVASLTLQIWRGRKLVPAAPAAIAVPGSEQPGLAALAARGRQPGAGPCGHVKRPTAGRAARPERSPLPEGWRRLLLLLISQHLPDELPPQGQRLLPGALRRPHGRSRRLGGARAVPPPRRAERCPGELVPPCVRERSDGRSD